MSQSNAASTAVMPHPLLDAHPELWASLRPLLHVRRYKADERVITHGDPAESFWLVYSGWVKLSRQTPDGKESIVGLCTAGDVFGEAALFPHSSYPYTAEVAGDFAELAALPAAAVRQLLSQHAVLSASVMAQLNERSFQAQLKLEHMSTLSAAQRLGCFLLRLCHAGEGHNKVIEIPVEKNVLAAYLGMKPETLSRSQQHLKTVGVHVNGAKVEITQVEKLATFVCGSCSEQGHCDVEEDLT